MSSLLSLPIRSKTARSRILSYSERAIGALSTQPPATAYPTGRARELLKASLNDSAEEVEAAEKWLESVSPELSKLQHVPFGKVALATRKARDGFYPSLHDFYSHGADAISKCAWAFGHTFNQTNELVRSDLTKYADAESLNLLDRLPKNDTGGDALRALRSEILQKRRHNTVERYSNKEHASDLLYVYFLIEARAIMVDVIEPSKEQFFQRYEHAMSNKENRDEKNTDELGSGYSRMSRRAVRRYQL